MIKISVDIEDSNAIDVLACHLEKVCDFKGIVNIVCIGTDKVIPDCLGPIVGTLLDDMDLPENVNITGTLEEPIHALNLAERVGEEVNSEAFIIAIDATRGAKRGQIQIMNKPIYPGRGVHKNLSYIGNVSIIGTTWENSEGTDIHKHKIRLGQVYAMSKIISSAIQKAVFEE
jgi:putative sporulation protein YyaC